MKSTNSPSRGRWYRIPNAFSIKSPLIHKFNFLAWIQHLYKRVFGDAMQRRIDAHIEFLVSSATKASHTFKANNSSWIVLRSLILVTMFLSLSSVSNGPSVVPDGSATGNVNGTTVLKASAMEDIEGNISKVYQHWADADMDWNNNILSANKSDYFEGEVIPHVFVYKASNREPLIPGNEYNFTITYNYYQQNTNAGGFAFITTYDISRDPDLLGANNTDTPPTIDNNFTGSGNQGVFYTVDADIIDASDPVTVGTGTLDQKVTVTFKYTGVETRRGFAEIYYGLYIAEPGQIDDQGNGPTDGASAWTGGSLQTTVDIEGSGATSIQLNPDAIIRGEISGTKYGDVNNNGQRDDGELGLAGWTIFLDFNDNGVLDGEEPSTVTDANGDFFFSVTPFTNNGNAIYVYEINQDGYTQTEPVSGSYGPIFITVDDPTETGLLFGNFFCVTPEVEAGNPQEVCEGTAILLNGATAADYESLLWTASVAGGSFDDPTTLNPTYTPPANYNGTITLTLTAQGLDQCAEASDNVTITFNDQPIANAGPDQTICIVTGNETVQLAGSTQGDVSSITWSGGNGSFAPNANDLNAVYTPTAGEIAAGSVTLTLTTDAPNQCTPDDDDVTITFNDQPIANAGPDQTICIVIGNETVQLAGSTQGDVTSITWSGGNGSFAPNANDLNAVYTPTAAEITAGSVTLTLTTDAPNQCTPDDDNVTITFNDQPIANAGPDQTICIVIGNETVQLAGSTQGDVSSITWSGGNGSFAPNANDLNAVYTPTAAEIAAGSVTLTLTTDAPNQCTPDDDDVTITFNDQPIANAGPDQTICIVTGNETVQLAGSTQGDVSSITWSGGNGSFAPNANDLNAVYTPTAGEIAAGSVTLTLTTDAPNQCTPDDDDVTITFNDQPIANAGPDQTICIITGNETVQLAGSTQGDVSSITWSGGNGSFAPNANDLNAVYTPTAGEIAAGSVTLTLTTDAPNQCTPDDDDVTITFNDQPIANAGPDQTICIVTGNETVQLAGSTQGDVSSITWSGGNGSFAPNANDLNAVYTPTAGEIAAGSVTLTLTTDAPNQCTPDDDDVTITFNDQPIANAGPDQTICIVTGNETVQLAGSTQGDVTSITWSGGNGSFAPNANDLNAVYTPTAGEIAAGSVTLTLTTDAPNQCTPDDDNVTITFNDQPIANAGPDQTICIVIGNETVQLAGSTQGDVSSITWSGGNGSFAPNANDLNAVYTPTAAEIAAGSVTLTLTTDAPNQCTPDDDDVTITFNDQPIANAGPDQTICIVTGNETVQLAGSTQGDVSSITWSGGNGSFAPNANDLNAVYTPTAGEIAAGSVTLTLTTDAPNQCTPDDDDVTITFNDQPIANAGPDQTICIITGNETVQLAGSTQGDVSSITWSGGNGSFAPNANDLNAVYTPTAGEIAAGSVTLTLTTDAPNQCTPDDDDVTITFNDQPIANAGPDQTICIVTGNETVQLAGSTQGDVSSITWSGGNGSFAPNANDLNAVYTPTAGEIAAGSVTLTLTTDAPNQCTPDDDDVTITFNDQPIANAGPDQTICIVTGNETVQLAGSTQGDVTSITWSGGNGSFAPNANDLNAVYTPTAGEIAAGSVTLTLTTDAPNQCTPDDDDVTITFNINPTIDAGPSFAICVDDAPANISATVGPNSIFKEWSSNGDGTFGNAGLASTTYQPGPNDLNEVAANGFVDIVLTAKTEANGVCPEAVDVVTLTINANPIANNFNAPAICEENLPVNNTIDLTTYDNNISAGTGDVTWYSDPARTEAFLIENPSVAPILAPPMGANPGINTYYAVVTNEVTGCTGEGSVKVDINPTPPCVIEGPESLCPEEVGMYVLAGGVPEGNFTLTWDITDNADLTVTGEGTVEVTTEACEGTITLSLIVKNDDTGCISSCTKDIMINGSEPPVITCPADVTITCDEELEMATATDDCGAVVTYEDVILTPPPTNGSCQCDGGMTSLTVQYNGDGDFIQVYYDKDQVASELLFEGNVVDGQEIVIYADDPETGPVEFEKLKANTYFYVGSEEYTIHTSCSKYILGFVTGPFTVKGWTDLNGNNGSGSTCDETVPPVESCACEKRMIELSVRYEGDPGVTVQALDKDGNTVIETYTDVQDGQILSVISWTIGETSLDTETGFQVVSPTELDPAVFHTSCSQDISDLKIGNFTVVGWVDGLGQVCGYSDIVPDLPAKVQRTWTATDACGNTDECIQMITIEGDDTPPMITCPADVTFDCNDENWEDMLEPPIATDNCFVDPIITFDDNAGDCSCQDGMRTLTVQYNGDPADLDGELVEVYYDKDKQADERLFSGIVFDGDIITVDVADLNDASIVKLKGDTRFYVGDGPELKVHTSCSKYIIGRTVGEETAGFTVKAWTDGAGNTCNESVPLVESCECRDMIELSVTYDGPIPATITTDFGGKDPESLGTFNVTTDQERLITVISWTIDQNKLKNDTYFSVNGQETKIHTSCSEPIVGESFNDFTVVGWLGEDGQVCGYSRLATEREEGCNTIYRTWIATDASGNTATCEQVISFTDGSESARTASEPVTREIEVSTRAQEQIELVAYPNPFVHTVKVDFVIPENTRVRLEVYNMAGKRVQILFDGDVESDVPYSGTFDATGLPNGTYIYRLITESKTKTGFLVPLR